MRGNRGSRTSIHSVVEQGVTWILLGALRARSDQPWDLWINKAGVGCREAEAAVAALVVGLGCGALPRVVSGAHRLRSHCMWTWG